MNPLLSPLFLSLGVVSLATGILGLWLPILPTTPFVLLASYCFARSSPPLHRWLHSQRHFGPTIVAWEHHGVIRPRAKFLAVSLISLSVGTTLLIASIPPFGMILILFVISGVVIYICSRPSHPRTIDFSRHVFSPVIDLPSDYEVYDFTEGYDPFRTLKSPFGIGRYNEKRVGVYTSPLFGGIRNIHMGIDIGAPVGTPIKAFSDGNVFLSGYNGADGDYGYTLITAHVLDGVRLFALHGHLSKESIEHAVAGKPIRRGEVIAWVGDRHENGGWNPHLHFQLSYEEPKIPDMPGVVSDEDREDALKKYPDPRLVLGSLY